MDTMQPEIYQEIKQRVDAGVEFADQRMPDWRQHVDPLMFDVGDSQYCFLGQWYNGKNNTHHNSGYFRARNELLPELVNPDDTWETDNYKMAKWCSDHGFTDTVYRRDQLNQVWAEKFVELGMLESANV